jgi:AraC-like DNA-binding protein
MRSGIGRTPGRGVNPPDAPDAICEARDQPRGTLGITACKHHPLRSHDLVQERLERAKELLASTDLSIGAIAGSAGCSDIFYFSAAFKNGEGIPPTLWRGGTPHLSAAAGKVLRSQSGLIVTAMGRRL